MRKLIYMAIAMSLFSCGSEPDVLTPIVGMADSHFRGNSIGDAYQSVVKNSVNDNPVTVEEGVISCEFKVDDAELLVLYEFDQEKLYSIQADIFFVDTVTLGTFQQTLIDRYNASYGEVDLESGFLVWKDRGTVGKEVEFTLADESIEFGRPKLSLTIYNFGY